MKLKFLKQKELKVINDRFSEEDSIDYDNWDLMSEEERLQLLNDVIRERYGDWATRKDIPIQDNHEASR